MAKCLDTFFNYSLSGLQIVTHTPFCLLENKQKPLDYICTHAHMYVHKYKLETRALSCVLIIHECSGHVGTYTYIVLCPDVRTYVHKYVRRKVHTYVHTFMCMYSKL